MRMKLHHPSQWCGTSFACGFRILEGAPNLDPPPPLPTCLRTSRSIRSTRRLPCFQVSTPGSVFGWAVFWAECFKCKGYNLKFQSFSAVIQTIKRLVVTSSRLVNLTNLVFCGETRRQLAETSVDFCQDLSCWKNIFKLDFSGRLAKKNPTLSFSSLKPCPHFALARVLLGSSSLMRSVAISMSFLPKFFDR